MKSGQFLCIIGTIYLAPHMPPRIRIIAGFGFIAASMAANVAESMGWIG